jgi:PadR family transcriptional regulator, regulatory protein PadR
MPTDFSLIQGTLDALILKTLTWGPRHGYAIARWIRTVSEDALDIEDRALYLALHRLEEKNWVEAEWGLSENNRRAKYYRLTTAGRRQLKTEVARLTEYTNALFKVLRTSAAVPGAKS